MSFHQLFEVSKLLKPDVFDIVFAWRSKREMLFLQLEDIPHLASSYKHRLSRSYSENPQMILVDRTPELRLANACEASSNGLYAMSEIAAKFANKISDCLPSHFNIIRKKAEKNELDTDLLKILSDLQWYRKVREIRTEWSHHSTIFIGMDKENNPLLVIQAHRNPSDLQEFKGNAICTVNDLAVWVRKAIETLDLFGDYLIGKYILPTLNPQQTLKIPLYDSNGVIRITEEGKLEGQEKITLAAYLRRLEL